MYDSQLTCEAFRVSIDDTNLSLFGRVGLEVRLNREAGMTKKSTLEVDDYFIGPDYNKPFSGFYKPRVYGLVRKSALVLTGFYYPIIYKPFDVYDIRETYLKEPPRIKKIFKRFF